MPRLSPEALEYLERRVDADRAYTLELLRIILPEPPRPPDVAALLSAIAGVAAEYFARSRVSGDVPAEDAGVAAEGGVEASEEEAAPELAENFVVLVGGVPVMQLSASCPAFTRTEAVRRVLKEHPEWRGLPVEAAGVGPSGVVGPSWTLSPAGSAVLEGYVMSGGRVRRRVHLTSPDGVAQLLVVYGSDAEIVLDGSPQHRVALTEAAEMLAAPPWWPDAPAEPDPTP